MGNQDPTAQEHAGECESRRYTRPDLANMAATRTTTRMVREDHVLTPTYVNTRKGKTRARLELESLVVPLFPPGRSQYLYILAAPF